MSETYTISVVNNRGANTNYAFFMDIPDFSPSFNSFMNVWYSSFLPQGGSTELTASNEFYAYTGTVPSSPAPGVVISSGTSKLARQGTSEKAGSTFDMKIESSFPTIKEITPSTAKVGAFEIDTGTDFTIPNNTYLIGLAKVNHRGQVAPVATLAPRNMMKIQVSPKMKFFITESQQIAGEIVDYNAVKRDGATVDFTSGDGEGKFLARAVQGSDGKWAVTYLDKSN